VFSCFFHSLVDRSSGMRRRQRGVECTRIVLKRIRLTHGRGASKIAKRVTKRIDTSRLQKKALQMNSIPIDSYLNALRHAVRKRRELEQNEEETPKLALCGFHRLSLIWFAEKK
jgi:hypothetical protein